MGRRVRTARRSEGPHAVVEGRSRASGSRTRRSPWTTQQVELPPHWTWCTLADVSGHIVDGTHHTPTYVSQDGVSFISAKDVKGGQILFNGCKMIPRTEFEELRKRCHPKQGDILFTKSGSIGEVAIVRGNHVFTLFESVALIPLAPSINREYASYVIYLGASGEFGQSNQKGVAVKHLHLKDLRRLPFPLPPLSEQERIATMAGKLLALCDTLESKLRDAEQGAQRLAEAMVAEMVA